MERERIVNISELEDIHSALYLDAVRLRSEMEKEKPSMAVIDELSKRVHLNALKAKDFEFYLESRIFIDQPNAKEEN